MRPSHTDDVRHIEASVGRWLDLDADPATVDGVGAAGVALGGTNIRFSLRDSVRYPDRVRRIRQFP